MRVKTIEKIFPLKETYSKIKTKIKSHFIISEDSLISKDYFILIGVNKKKLILVIQASVDRTFGRTYLSILLLSSKLLIKSFNLKNNVNIIQTISNISKIIRSNGNIAYNYPFLGLKELSMPSSSEKRRLLKLETQILNLIIKELYKIYDYSDQIPKFPFSITYIDQKRAFWETSYNYYLTSIEKKIENVSATLTDVYRNYDFALNKDIFPRIIDLFIIEKFEANREEIQVKNPNFELLESLDVYNYILTFIYCHRNSNPYSLMSLLKFMNEIKSFAKIFKQKNKQDCNEVSPQVVIISLKGFEDKVKNYLREHLLRQTDYIIPIFVIPPINDEVWHNFIDYKQSKIIKSSKRKELEKIIEISKSQYISDAFRFSKTKAAVNEYEEIIQREKIAKLDKLILEKWGSILNVSNSTQLLKPKNEIEEYISFKYLEEDFKKKLI